MLKNKWFWFLGAIVYTALLLYLSLANIDGYLSPDTWIYQDKVYHFVAYIILALLWSVYLIKTTLKRPLYISFFTTLLFGIVLEYVQEIISPFRTYDTLDLIANCLGVIVGTIIVYYFIVNKVKID